MLYTVKQAAEILTLAEVTIRLWITQGKIKPVRLGRAIRIPRSEIDRLMKGE